jgi:hypothetical protein
MKKLRELSPQDREAEIFHFIEKAILSASENEISCYNEHYEIPDETIVVILDKWKGKLAKKISEVI